MYKSPVDVPNIRHNIVIDIVIVMGIGIGIYTNIDLDLDMNVNIDCMYRLKCEYK